MVKRIHSIDQLNPDIFEAIKRAYIKMGIVPRPKQEILKSQEIVQTSKDRHASKTAGRDMTNDSQHAADVKAKKYKDENSPNPGDASGGPEEEKQKNEPKSPKAEQTLQEVTSGSDEILFEASTVFPFTLVPDTIKLDREKLTVANRYFWKTANITSTPVSEIMSCEANVGPIFGSLHLTFRFFTDNQREIKFFWREDALNFQRLMHGYIIANRKEIDVSSIPTGELKELLEKLGTGASD